MSKATVSILVFGTYASIAGLIFLFIPNLMLSILGLPGTNEGWVRVVGLLVFFVGGYYLIAAQNNLVPFYLASAYFRVPFAMGLFLLVYLGVFKPGLALIGVLDLLGAAWTWWGLRADSSVKSFTALVTGHEG